jgi:hypothetical protein
MINKLSKKLLEDKNRRESKSKKNKIKERLKRNIEKLNSKEHS